MNQTINFLYNQVFGVTTRVLLQLALTTYATGNQSSTVMTAAYNDLRTAIGTQGNILSGQVYSPNFTAISNLSYTGVSYDYPKDLYPTGIPPLNPNDPRNASAGQVLGPVSVPQTPGGYALSFTIPIADNNSTTTILGYMSMIVSGSGLIKAVNDSTGMGHTGQLLVISQADQTFQVVLPPLRTPDLFGQEFNISESPAVGMAFANQTGYLTSTHNALGQEVSVGYTVCFDLSLLMKAPVLALRSALGSPSRTTPIRSLPTHRKPTKTRRNYLCRSLYSSLSNHITPRHRLCQEHH